MKGGFRPYCPLPELRRRLKDTEDDASRFRIDNEDRDLDNKIIMEQTSED